MTRSGADTAEIRNCRSMEELRACVALQQEVWHFSDADMIPLRTFIVAEKIGGQIIGAFHGGQLVGFVCSLPGARDGRPYLHSHMLAVREGWRDSGLGRRLKLAQREDALQHRFELMEWTFDPLEIKNAYFNFARLGIVVRRYLVNHYGDSSSPLQGGLPTDRLLAEWWMKSQRVTDVIGGKRLPGFCVEKKIGVPADIYQWKASGAHRDRAAETQKRIRDEFLEAFSRDLAALGYESDPQGNGAFLLGRWKGEEEKSA